MDVDEYFDKLNKDIDDMEEWKKQYLEYNILVSPLSNYYGKVYLQRVGNKYYMALEDHDVNHGVEVSKEFATAFVKEFKDCLDRKQIDLD